MFSVAQLVDAVHQQGLGLTILVLKVIAIPICSVILKFPLQEITQ